MVVVGCPHDLIVGMVETYSFVMVVLVVRDYSVGMVE